MKHLLTTLLAAALLTACNAGHPNDNTNSTNNIEHQAKYLNGEKLNTLPNEMQKFADSTYLLSCTMGSFMAVAIAPDKLLTVRHSFMVGDLDYTKNFLDSLSQPCRLYNKNYVVAEVDLKSDAQIDTLTSPTRDLAKINFKWNLFPKYLSGDDLFKDTLPDLANSLATTGGVVYAIGSPAASLPYPLDNMFHVAKKDTGKSNFAVEANGEIKILANKGLNGSQIISIPGDSGGPWVLCRDSSCKLIGIQALRWDKSITKGASISSAYAPSSSDKYMSLKDVYEEICGESYCEIY